MCVCVCVCACVQERERVLEAAGVGPSRAYRTFMFQRRSDWLMFCSRAVPGVAYAAFLLEQNRRCIGGGSALVPEVAARADANARQGTTCPRRVRSIAPQRLLPRGGKHGQMGCSAGQRVRQRGICTGAQRAVKEVVVVLVDALYKSCGSQRTALRFVSYFAATVLQRTVACDAGPVFTPW